MQKRLTKAAPWIAGELTRRIGLRYAPELRFYLDTTFKQMQEYENMANDYIKEARDEEVKRRLAEKEAALNKDFNENQRENFLETMETLAKSIEDFIKMTPQQQRAKLSMTIDEE